MLKMLVQHTLLQQIWVMDEFHMQEEKRRMGTSLVGRHMGQHMGQHTGLHMGLHMLEVRTSMLRDMVEAMTVRGICSRQ